MNTLRQIPLPLLLLGLAMQFALEARGQATLENGYRNVFGPGPALPEGVSPVPVGVAAPANANDVLKPAYDAQRQNGTAFGGFPTYTASGAGYGTLQVNTGVPAAYNAALVQYPKSTGGVGVVLRSAIIGRPLVVFNISYNFGGEIIPPKTLATGQTAAFRAEPLNSRLKTTVKVDGSGVETERTVVNASVTDIDGSTTSTAGGIITTVTIGPNPQFYWSKHVQKVYATQPGTIEVVWRELNNASGTRELTYSIATSPDKPERTIYWTENGFKGPLVSVPAGRVNELKIIYNSLVPKDVAKPYLEPWLAGATDLTQTDPAKRRYKTFYLENDYLHAYNVEGRVFVEYLGNPRGDGTSEQKGTEIVNVIKETTPGTLVVSLGDKVEPLRPPAAGGVTEDLEARVIAGLGLAANPFLHQHISAGGSDTSFYAIRETLPGEAVSETLPGEAVSEGKVRQVSNEVLIHWMETSPEGNLYLKWPKQYLGYVLEWPALSLKRDKYSIYARPDSGLPGGPDAAVATAVQLDSSNNPALVYQDDPANTQAVLLPGNKFYTKITAADDENRALIRYTKDDDIWFERVLSELDRNLPGYSGNFQTTVSATLGTGDSAPIVGPYASLTVTDPNAPSRVFVEGTDYTISTGPDGDVLQSGYTGAADIDAGFDPGDGGNFYAITVQPDDRILVGGDFTNLGGQPRNRIGRLNPDGAVTLNFNPDVNSNNNSFVEIRTIAVQSDAKILVGGRFNTLGPSVRNRIGRLNADGSVDGNFNPGANDLVHALVVQPDGKILVAGRFTNIGSVARNRIARLNEDGTVDTTFNPGTGADDVIYNLAVQPDGKILVVGNFTTFRSVARNRIARLNADGTLDSTFDPGPGADLGVFALALQADGKILVGGAFSSLGGESRSHIGRLNADGTLDAAFNSSVGGTIIYALAVEQDGKILVGGIFTTLNGQFMDNIGRLNADGSLVVAFNPGANGSVRSFAIQPDRKILVGGSFTILGGEPRRGIGRLTNVTSLPKNITLTYSTQAVADIGTRLAPLGTSPYAAYGNGNDAVYVGYIHQRSGTAFDVLAYKDPFVVGFGEAAKGAIIPVNALAGKDELEVWWYRKSKPNGTAISGTFWPSFVLKYKLRWPTTFSTIDLASNKGSDDLPSLQATGQIYYQNDPAKPGYNPNEEHALMLNGRAWALRDDLNLDSSSKPFVLLHYTEADQRPAMRAFQVTRGTFNYPAVAGKVLQSPMPLPLLPPPLLADKDRTLASYEKPGVPETFPLNAQLGTADSAFAHYQKFTWTDRKGTLWVYRGPHQGNVPPAATPPTLVMRYFYKTLPGFHFPSVSQQPAVGTITPYLRKGTPGAYVGHPVTGVAPTTAGEPRAEQPMDVVFRPQWPDTAPELRVGETLTLPKLGLPSVRGQASAELIYQQSVANNNTPGLAMAERQQSARLFDPTRAKKYPLSASTLAAIPDSVNTSRYLGKVYFPNLPPHLSARLYFDPAEGTDGALVFKGVFMNEQVGEKYLQLNVMSKADVLAAKGLVPSDPAEDKTKWDAAIDGLATTMETFIENPNKLGTFIPLTNETATPRPPIIIDGVPQGILPGNAPLIATAPVGSEAASTQRPPVPPGDLAEVFYSDTAVDSYAVSASGGGSGFVVLAVGNGRNKDFTPPGQPVSLAVFKVAAPLYRGELKVINSQNPLDEKLTLQHTGDFAGKPEEYDFEWRYAPPVDGLPPRLYSFVRKLIVADSNNEWVMIQNPVANDQDPALDYRKYRSLEAEVNDLVTYINVEAGGRGYTSPPVLTLSGGGGTGAAGRAILNGDSVSSIVVTNRGSGYTSAPTVTFSGGGGNGAAVSVTIGEPIVDPALIAINDGQGTDAHGTTLPHALLRRTFHATQRPLRLFLSLDLGANDGALVHLNGAQVASYRAPGYEDSATTTVPATAPAFDPLPLVFEINANALAVNTDGTTPTPNVVTVELFTTDNAGSTTSFNLRLEGSQEVESLLGWLSVNEQGDVESDSLESKNNNAATPPTTGIFAVTGKNRHTIQGTSILTLSDNWFIMRYRAKDPGNAAYVANAGWSKWTEPQLAEGWIKRVLAGINPFQQRVKDLFNNQIETSVSLVEQAGKRWEGNIALNLANINDSGLIEIYETVLNRGKDLSIDGTPAINYGGANDALLLAAGYLSDLYMVLGNEAYADAANSTIAFSTATAADFVSQYGDVATALFAFKGQLASVLDEELTLLRGRDDSLLPGARKTPIYNRLIWNYTRGISSGEAIYALNYNIRDRAWDYSLNSNNIANLPTDGIISAADAAISYPQGHGDAYGHYLTALKGYYSLLNNPNFSWTPRIEAVLVLGTPVSVDYQDERKFAAAAAAVARSAGQVVDLTYRQQFTAAENAGWNKLKDGKGNANTGVTRHWGTDEWACRGGQGALFHWITANSLLPAVDPDPSHSGIQKIDRTTVPELAEIAAQAAVIQQSLDNADAKLNPLGLPPGGLTFDISPSEVDAGKTHFEQIYQRATGALQNAASAFTNARGSTQFLRQQEDSLEDRRNSIRAQEQAYTNQLIELYGTPYTDDIGPGRTYSQDYAGPDLLHSMYVDITEDIGGFSSPGGGGGAGPDGEYVLYLTLSPDKMEKFAGVTGFSSDLLAGGPAPAISDKVLYTYNPISGELRKPSAWTGRRASPGRMQTTVSKLLLARQQLFGALYDYDRLKVVMEEKIALYNSAVEARTETLATSVANDIEKAFAEATVAALDLVISSAETTSTAIEITGQIGVTVIPGNAGTTISVGAPAKAAVLTAAALAKKVPEVAIGFNEGLKTSIEVAQNAVDRAFAQGNAAIEWNKDNTQLKYELKQSLQEFYDKQGPLDAALRNIDQAQRDLYALQAEGDRIQQQRLVYRQHSAAIIQGFRTRDFAFRAFRDEALQRYKALFDLSARYTYLAAQAYDYETGLLDSNGNASAAGFFEKIVQARALGVISNGQPQFAGASTGDPGLSGVLAELAGDWSVAKTRLGFNNPDRYATTFSLRGEKFRLVPGGDGDLPWKDILSSHRMTNILEDPDVKRYCMQVADPNGAAVPGIVIPFSSTIATGYNFFGQPLAGGDHTFTPSSFSTKIRSSGLAFRGYVGMDSPTTTSGTLGGIGATSPETYNSGFSDPNALSATPYIYLIPVGADSMRSPPLGDTSFIRTWSVQDQAIPLPFNIANSDYSSQPAWVTAASLSEPPFTLRKHQAFRAVPDGTNFQGGYGFTNARLIGRSAWNSQWKIVIPGNTLLSDPNLGIQTFINTVKDIKLHLETYSYSGN